MRDDLIDLAAKLRTACNGVAAGAAIGNEELLVEAISRLFKAAREAADALEAAREDGWQPIETAPKDGTTVIGFWCGSRGAIGVVNGTNYGITAFNPDRGEWYNASEADNVYDEWARPDFWRPLPAPPAIDQARGKGVARG